MSAETIKLITGIGEPMIGAVTTYDALTGHFRELHYGASDEVAPVTELIDYEAFCGLTKEEVVVTPIGPETISAVELAELFSRGLPVQVVDIREPFERVIAVIEPSDFLPLGSLARRIDEIRHDVPVVLYCHTGVRSAQALVFLRNAGYNNIRHLAGGIEAYSVQINPALARY